MRTGTISKPSNSFVTPNVKRLIPNVGSRPMVFRSRPNRHVTRAFCQCFPPRVATVVRPMIQRAKYSEGQNLRAAFERGTEKKIRMIAPIRPPKTDAQREIPMASPALPFFSMG